MKIAMVGSEFYYSILDKFSIVAITDKAGKIIYANNKFCEISRYSREELVGSTHKIVNSGKHSKEFFAALWETISSGKMWRGEICNKTKTGDYYWVDTFIIPELDENNKVVKYYSIRIDITDRKQKEEEVIQQKLELEKIALMQSHQVRKPVANIIGLIHIIEQQGFNGELREKLKLSADELESTINYIVTKADNNL